MPIFKTFSPQSRPEKHAVAPLYLHPNSIPALTFLHRLEDTYSLQSGILTAALQVRYPL